MQSAVSRLIQNNSGMSDAQVAEQTNSTFKYWRFRIMYSILLGYAGFYLIRQNFSLAIPFIQSDLGYSKTQIGSIISVAALIYGPGKAISGMIGDRISPRYLMTIGLVGSAMMSFCMGLSSTLTMFMVIWVINQIFQSMGSPPCIRLLAHWFSPREMGTKWAFWNMSQQIGSAAILVIGAALIPYYGWRSVFFVPALIAILIAFILFNRLRDTPESLGLPSIEEHHGIEPAVDDNLTSRQILTQLVLKNRLVWYMCFANFFVYLARMCVFNWAPTFLREFKGSSLHTAAHLTAAYDIAGMFGGLVAGYMSDKMFKGHRGRVGALFMLALSLCTYLLWITPVGTTWLHLGCMVMIGFLLSGPQILVGVAAADFSSKKAASTANGLTGTFGYFGTAVAGVGIGAVVDYYGWDYAFMMMIASGILGAAFFALSWNHRSKTLEEAF
jgi:glycerol-3-phosphate transporter